MSKRSVILCAALFAMGGLVLAGCGGDDDGGDTATKPVVDKPAPKPAPKPDAPKPDAPEPGPVAPPKPAPAPPAPKPAPAPEPEPEPEPEVESGSAMKHPWARFGVGSFAELKNSTVMEIMGNKTETEMTMKQTLKEITDTEVVVEMAMSGGPMGEMPPQETRMPLDQVDMPKNADGTAIEPKDDTVTVAAGTFKCKLWEFEREQMGNTVKTQMWTCDDVPGAMVKMRSTMTGQMSSDTTMELTSFDAK